MFQCKRVRSMSGAAAALAVALLLAPGALAGESAQDGKAVFMSAKCNMCHTVPSAGIEAKVKSEKMKGPDLAGVTAEADWLAQFLRKKADKDGVQHKNEFKGTDEELKLLVDWIKSLP